MPREPPPPPARPPRGHNSYPSDRGSWTLVMSHSNRHALSFQNFTITPAAVCNVFRAPASCLNHLFIIAITLIAIKTVCFFSQLCFSISLQALYYTVPHYFILILEQFYNSRWSIGKGLLASDIYLISMISSFTFVKNRWNVHQCMWSTAMEFLIKSIYIL